MIKKRNKNPKLIVALDVDTYRKAGRLVKALAPYVQVFKVGNILFTQCGPKIIQYIHKKGAKVFLDLKYFDIPNTVANAAAEATKMGVYMMNMHALAGEQCMKLTAKTVRQKAKELHIFKPILVAVTILTSMKEEDLEPLGIEGPVDEVVTKYAKLAQKAGVDGIVASPLEIIKIKKKFGDNFVVVTPGIRPEWAQTADDQKRVMTPKEAIEAGSDFIVIGRPIIQARRPVEAVKKILEEIQE
ncbi:MAG: orotidine-5'-phosphate decarboxylase [Candidatus Omnitrophica bacterium]|jgi:orotidine-5'-phosphate decarboxylase|nr:orotidine-5'-phosphate decarboxylase [Candidatus Omnitrophota bacterium]